jgi:hypothetical protein
VDLFSSNTLFGEPGIYPEGTPMAPAEEPSLSDDEIRAALEEVVTARAPRARVAPLLARFDTPEVADALPDLGVRAGLFALAGTVGAPVLDGFPRDTTSSRVRYGTPASAGRIVGPPADGDPDGPERVVNDRYLAEHPALLAGSLAHDLLWTPATTGHAAEAMLHAVVAMVHVQLVARVPRLAHLGTELARRQNSLAITLLNSRRPGDPRVRLRAPDGPGTIPGGNPKMQTPDFWSIPFAPTRDDPAPALFARVLDELVPRGVTHPTPLRFDDALAAWIDEHGDDRWLTPDDQLAAMTALGLG